MNESKHTPAPWTLANKVNHETNPLFADWRQDVLGPIQPEKGSSHVVVATVINRDAPYGEANAALIAAAPDLLEALKGCADMLREAGKSFALNNPLAARPNLCELHEAKARAAIARAGGAK